MPVPALVLELDVKTELDLIKTVDKMKRADLLILHKYITTLISEPPGQSNAHSLTPEENDFLIVRDVNGWQPHKLQVIKMVRERLNLGLKEAHDLVMGNRPIKPIQSEPVTPPKRKPIYTRTVK